MPHLTRRALLATTAAIIASPGRADTTASPPVAPIRPVTESYFGTDVTDRYRWMEAASPEWQAYIRAQGAYASQVLGKIPGRGQLAAAIARNTGAAVSVLSIQTGGNKIFTQIGPAGELFVRDDIAGPDRKLVDPDSTTGTTAIHDSLGAWTPSPDGTHVAYGIASSGGVFTLRIVATDTGAVLPEAIGRVTNTNPNWLPDGTGFFYNRLQNDQKTACWLHKLNTDPATDVTVLGQGLTPEIPVQDIDFPNIYTTPGSSIAIGALVSSVQNELTLYAALLSAIQSKPAWTEICTAADNVTAFAVHGETIYLLTHQDAARYRILKTSVANPNIAHATQAVPQTNAVIRGIAAARDGLYILDLDAGLAGLRRLAPDGKITKIKLPFAGSINQPAFYANPLQDGVWFLLQNWVHPAIVCHAAPDGTITQTNIAPRLPLNPAPYASVEMFVTSRDGVQIPLSIIYRKGLKRDGRAPLLLQAYGAYGLAFDPVFLSRWLAFLDLGGVFAVAHVRGGGELGEDWHRGGKKRKKYHSWQDMIDCAEDLIAQRWTSHKHLAIIGNAAGGITAGRLLTERPDLAAVIISECGMSDALRGEFSPGGSRNIPEFGTVTTEHGFHGLYAMDAYQHVHDGVKYPAILLTTCLNNASIPAWEATKMTARLQAATASNNPVLLRVEPDANRPGLTRTQRDAETADIIAFIMWRTGDPHFQPKG